MALTVLAGQIVLADDLNKLVPVTVEKSADTSRSSTTTMASDPHLVLSLSANATYEIDGILLISSAADNAGDFKYQWSWTNTATVTIAGSGPANTITTGTTGDGEWIRRAADSTTPTLDVVYAASTTGMSPRIFATVVTGTSAVTLTLQWAQFGSNANATTLESGSRLTARRTA